MKMHILPVFMNMMGPEKLFPPAPDSAGIR